MYVVASKFCPTDRDVYLRYVLKASGQPTFRIALGKMIHGAVSDCLLAYLNGKEMTFKEWWDTIRWDEIPAKPESVREPAEIVWNYVAQSIRARHAELAAVQPYASSRDLFASTAPFLIEHKISGDLLGLSGLLSLDCYDYLHCIMFDLKVDSQPHEWHRLAPVGYALVFESVHEVPVDVCAVVYAQFKDKKLVVKKDLFFASDELRSWWIQERDRKLEIVAEGRDPGKPEKSQSDVHCMFYRECWGEDAPGRGAV
jgi:CRISPR-associated protein Csa1